MTPGWPRGVGVRAYYTTSCGQWIMPGGSQAKSLEGSSSGKLPQRGGLVDCLMAFVPTTVSRIPVFVNCQEPRLLGTSRGPPPAL